MLHLYYLQTANYTSNSKRQTMIMTEEMIVRLQAGEPHQGGLDNQNEKEGRFGRH